MHKIQTRHVLKICIQEFANKAFKPFLKPYKILNKEIMKSIRLTYKVVANKNPYAQKTVSATVSNNSNAISQFEEKVKERLGDVKFNHAGKIVIL